MRRIVPLLLISGALLAQDPPSGDEKFQGSVDFGYRWIGNVGGDFQTYRSVVNFGEGLKLLGADLKYNAERRWLDRVTLRGNGWGGEPFSTAFLEAEKTNIYRLNYDYRGISYFNFLPSFANPGLDRGFYMNQRSFDTRYHVHDLRFEVKPGSTLVPYFAWSRAQSGGRGISNFVLEGNEYPLSNSLSFNTNDYRGGVRFEHKWLNGFVEQGGLTIGESQYVLPINGAVQTGNRQTPYLGQTLFIDNAVYTSQIDGASIYTRGALSAAPTTWLNLNGQFLFSQPETNVFAYSGAGGNLVQQNPLLFFDAGSISSNSFARQPHSSATFGAEFRPVDHVRVVNTFFTDRMHNAASLQAVESILGNPIFSNTNTRLEVNNSFNQTDAFLDYGRLTVRGGWRYVWGDARTRPGQLTELSTGQTFEQADLKQGVALLGTSYRVGKFSTNVDVESGRANQVYFRTSLANFLKARGRASYNITDELTVTGTARFLDNENPRSDIQLDYQAQDYGGTVLWNPKRGERYSVMADYAHTYIRSDLGYLTPQTLRPALSVYRDRANTGTVMADLKLPAWYGRSGVLTGGGSIFVSEGSRPSRYYQPIVRLAVPVERYMTFSVEYRWYGFTQPMFLYEGFRNHQLLFAVRIGR